MRRVNRSRMEGRVLTRNNSIDGTLLDLKEKSGITNNTHRADRVIIRPHPACWRCGEKLLPVSLLEIVWNSTYKLQPTQVLDQLTLPLRQRSWCHLCRRRKGRARCR